jgi:hypothetical protein
MVPSGGGTIEGELLFVAGRSANPIGVWSYVALTYDGSRLRLFVDGHQAASRPTTGPVATARNPLWFGGNHPFGEFFEGLIDEARVYDRALSDAEIRADMEKSVASGGAVRGRANAVAGPRAASRRAAGLVAALRSTRGRVPRWPMVPVTATGARSPGRPGLGAGTGVHFGVRSRRQQ